jgi:hypothetical protein
MDIKEYIERFDEISHLSREKQFTVLEQARDEVQSNTSLPSFALMAFVVRVSFISLFVGVTYFFWEISTLKLVFALVLGLVFARIVVSEINDRLMLSGLKRVLSKSPKQKSGIAP